MLSHAFHTQVSDSTWREPDLSVLASRRGPVPAVPLALLPQPWRGWIGDTERATGAPADYVLQSVLAGVAAVCGAGVVVRVTPAWSEPLVLWLTAVGEPRTGKSAALAPMRRLLDVIEQERRLGDEERRAAHDERSKADGKGSAAVSAPFVSSQVVATDDEPAALVESVSGNPRGLLLWRDGPAAWIGGEAEDDPHRATWLAAWEARAVTMMRPRQPPCSVRHFPLSMVETVRPERLKAALEEGDGTLAARFLFAWPGAQPYRTLAVIERSLDEEVLQRLRALSRLGNGADDPHVIEVDARGRAALDGVLATLHAERQKAEGPEATWLGASRSLIVRLAGVLELLGSIDRKVVRPGAIGKEQVEAAATLWRDYFWPHAKAVFDSAELSDYSKRVRRVARWLLATQAKAVSREEVRRRALCQAATAEETQHVLERLAYLGFVRADLSRERVGRATTHWLVNPAIIETEKPVAQLA
jgi:hypothetical protein